jgi:uncharacterized membrane protein
MNTSLIHTIDVFAVFVGLIGVSIIMVGVVHGLRDFIALEIGVKHRHISQDSIRYTLGMYLLLGLEFMVAADIIETLFKPSLEHLGVLGWIVIIRTVLNYFLNMELEHIKKEVH